MKNNDIKVLSRGCKIMYAVYLFAVIFFAGVYELLPEAKGQLVGNDVAEYALDTVCVLLTMITVPLSLKLFAHLLLRRIQPFLRQATFQLRLDRVEFVEEAFLLQSSLGPVFVVVVMKPD